MDEGLRDTRYDGYYPDSDSESDFKFDTDSVGSADPAEVFKKRLLKELKESESITKVRPFAEGTTWESLENYLKSGCAPKNHAVGESKFEQGYLNVVMEFDT